MPMTPEIAAAASLLFGYAETRERRLKQRALKLAHYTTAEVAAQILLKQNIWLRNASSMNDYMEHTFGAECLKACLRELGPRLINAVDQVYPNLLQDVLTRLTNSDQNHRFHTYLTSLSEHRPTDELGLLSMWRAYGGPTAGVALVFNTDFLDVDSTDLAAWSSPVLYGDVAFRAQFEATVARLEENTAVLASVDRDILANVIFNSLQFAILSAKHVGFREEREWRIIHIPRENSSAWVQSSFQSIRGKPEVVYHLPLKNEQGMNLPEVDLNRLLYRVIIGPCQNPYQVASTIEDILRSLAIEEPDKRIRLSMIPLRQRG